MKTQNITKALFGMILALSNTGIHAGDTYQYKVLFNPSEANLASEKRGRVMIYNGMKEEEVELAMENQFDRIVVKSADFGAQIAHRLLSVMTQLLQLLAFGWMRVHFISIGGPEIDRSITAKYPYFLVSVN